MAKSSLKILQLSAGSDLVPGDICSIKRDDFGFGVIKILVVDHHIFHIRKYKNRFAERPHDLDSACLSVGSLHDPEGFGVAHLPISATGFGSWMPARIRTEEITAEELEGYHCWLQDQEGAWEDA